LATPEIGGASQQQNKGGGDTEAGQPWISGSYGVSRILRHQLCRAASFVW
jgi:hypothetical protein